MRTNNGKSFSAFAEEIRTRVDEELPRWKENFPGSEQLKIAVMGCIVNGPGEARSADVGIFPRKGEGKLQKSMQWGKSEILSGEENISKIFRFWEEYLQNRFKNSDFGCGFSRVCFSLEFLTPKRQDSLVNIHFHEISE